MPASDIGIDLGTRNSLVYSTGRACAEWPSIEAMTKYRENQSNRRRSPNDGRAYHL